MKPTAPPEIPAWQTSKPVSTRCPSIDAAAIYAVSVGDLDLNRAQQVTTEPHFIAKPQVANTPSASTTLPAFQPKQPNRLQFDAADIYELSLAPHPWKSEPIAKRADEDYAAPKAG